MLLIFVGDLQLPPCADFARRARVKRWVEDVPASAAAIKIPATSSCGGERNAVCGRLGDSERVPLVEEQILPIVL